MITFAEARAIVQAEYSQDYPAEADFVTAPDGYETEELWIVKAGPYARLYGARNETEEQWEEPVLDEIAITVNKETGELGGAQYESLELTPYTG